MVLNTIHMVFNIVKYLRSCRRTIDDMCKLISIHFKQSMTEFNQNIREWVLYSYQLQGIFHCFASYLGYFSWCPIFHGALFSGALFSWVPYFLGAPFSWCPIFLVPYFLRCLIFQGTLFSGALYSGALSSGALLSGALYSHHP